MTDIKKRKSGHIDVVLEDDVGMSVSTGFDDYHFMHQALPELALEDVSLKTPFLGHKISAPFLISGMTGGHQRAGVINRNLGEAAQALGIPMGVGSQRIMLEYPEVADSFQAARDAAPDVPIFGNLGAVQLNHGIGAEGITEIVEAIRGDGCFLHINPLQEAVQDGGNTNYRGLLDQIGEVADKLEFPLLVKEVGCGIAPGLASSLAERGIAAIDVSGAGGTSWSAIEGRLSENPQNGRLGEVFRNWGIPTAEGIQLCRRTLPDLPLIASGGIRTGLEAAKAIALGADMVACAEPLLEAASQSAEAVTETLKQIMYELRVAMFLLGAGDITALKAAGPQLYHQTFLS